MDRTRWAVREALAFDGYPKTAEEVAAMLDENYSRVIRALRTLRRRGEVRARGKGPGQRWFSTEPLRIG